MIRKQNTLKALYGHTRKIFTSPPQSAPSVENFSISHRVVVILIDRVPQAKHSISQAFEVGFSISEICGGLLQPLAEPFCRLCGLAVCIGGQKEHTNCFACALETNKKNGDQVLGCIFPPVVSVPAYSNSQKNFAVPI